MIRLTLALLATMFVTFMIAGQDRGQVRYGLITAAPVTPQNVVSAQAPPSEAVPETDAETDLVQAVFVPTPPLVVAPAPGATPQAETSTALVAPEPSADTEPQALVRYISVSSANVRKGPAKDFAVIGKLARGEAVAVVSATEGPDGWTLIRIEGDGLGGYVSNALLSDAP